LHQHFRGIPIWWNITKKPISIQFQNLTLTPISNPWTNSAKKNPKYMNQKNKSLIFDFAHHHENANETIMWTLTQIITIICIILLSKLRKPIKPYLCCRKWKTLSFAITPPRTHLSFRTCSHAHEPIFISHCNFSYIDDLVARKPLIEKKDAKCNLAHEMGFSMANIKHVQFLRGCSYFKL